MNYLEFLKIERKCPFCESKDLIIVENKHAYLTYSLAPYHTDHLMVVTKRHIEHILDITDKEMKDVHALEKLAVRALHKAGYANVSLLVREGDNVQKSVPHMHYHIIPNVPISVVDNTNNDLNRQKRNILSKKEINATCRKIKRIISKF